MKYIFFFILVCFTGQMAAKTIVDMAGRRLDLPDNIDRVLPYDAKVSMVLFPVAYNKMVGKALLPGNKKYQLIAEEYNKLPQIDVKNIEALLASNPQVIIAGTYVTSENFDRYEKIQKRTHIPVVIIDLSLDKMDKTYEFIGSLLECKDQCYPCTSFLQMIYKDTEHRITESGKNNTGVYYTIGGSGLMTDPSGSKHTEVLDYMKLNNVVKVPVPTGGHANVNMEQVLLWNPDYIFTAGFKGDKNAYTIITSSNKWKSISAVRNHKVYKVPSQPMGWFDHPPTVNRIPGIIWLSELFYGQPKEDAQKKIIQFYKLFYKYDLSKKEYENLF